MQKFAKNYIPILFNLYIAESKPDNQDKTRLAVLETIKIYFKVTETQVNGLIIIIIFFMKNYLPLKACGNFL